MFTPPHPFSCSHHLITSSSFTPPHPSSCSHHLTTSSSLIPQVSYITTSSPHDIHTTLYPHHILITPSSHPHHILTTFIPYHIHTTSSHILQLITSIPHHTHTTHHIHTTFHTLSHVIAQHTLPSPSHCYDLVRFCLWRHHQPQGGGQLEAHH